MIKLSIIVPVYNVEKYIHSCFECIFRQELDETEFEVIIVNDGTKDNSMEKIADFIKEHSNISVINQENQGLSVARNNGIAKAKGEYVYMPDPDDLLIDNYLSVLLDIVVEAKADLIVADFLKMIDDEIAQFEGIKQESFQYMEKTGKELLVEDLNPKECYVWRTLYRREFLIKERLTFVPGVFYQDVPFTHECYLKARKCIRTSIPFYIYRIRRPGATTSSFNTKKAKDLCIVIAKTWELRLSEYHTPKTLHKLENDVFSSFSLLISLVSYSIRDSSERKEILHYLRGLSPDLYFKNGAYQQITTFMFRTMPTFYLNLNITYRRIKKDITHHFFGHN